jgi:aspartyl-tRNA synthetase
MNKDLEEEINRRMALQKAAMETNLQKPLPESPTVYEGKPNARSNKTLEKLRGLTKNLSAQLTELRNTHIVQITTLSTELCDVQREQIQELEKEVERLNERLGFYINWEESRELTEMIDRNEALEAKVDDLAARLAKALLGQ